MIINDHPTMSPYPYAAYSLTPSRFKRQQNVIHGTANHTLSCLSTICRLPASGPCPRLMWAALRSAWPACTTQQRCVYRRPKRWCCGNRIQVTSGRIVPKYIIDEGLETEEVIVAARAVEGNIQWWFYDSGSRAQETRLKDHM